MASLVFYICYVICIHNIQVGESEEILSIMTDEERQLQGNQIS